MKSIIVGAGSDLGVHIDGSKLGPTQLINDIDDLYDGEIVEFFQDPSYIKDKNILNKEKNKDEINKLNEKIYFEIKNKIEKGYFPIMIGGDHSVSVASSLADVSINKDIGIIWIDAHTDYNTFESTVTGNIHGLPLAAITGYHCEDLRLFHNGNVISPSKTVVVGARSIDNMEIINIRNSGITVFTTEDIKKEGIKNIMDKAFKIAGYNNKIHISYDLDVIDPKVVPGVSIPEIDGISGDEAIQICDYIIDHFDKISSYDIVEFNPLLDKEDKTKKIASYILRKTIRKVCDIEENNLIFK